MLPSWVSKSISNFHRLMFFSIEWRLVIWKRRGDIKVSNYLIRFDIIDVKIFCSKIQIYCALTLTISVAATTALTFSTWKADRTEVPRTVMFHNWYIVVKTFRMITFITRFVFTSTGLLTILNLLTTIPTMENFWGTEKQIFNFK